MLSVNISPSNFSMKYIHQYFHPTCHVYCCTDFYISTGKVYELEKCLLHMNVKNLNIQKVSVFSNCL